MVGSYDLYGSYEIHLVFASSFQFLDSFLIFLYFCLLACFLAYLHAYTQFFICLSAYLLSSWLHGLHLYISILFFSFFCSTCMRY